jgi:ABC-type Na+ transport system ATPase subunit NatA
MEKWLENIRHEKGLYHMMYDKESIESFGKEFQLDRKQSKTAISDWYSQRGD